VASKFAIRGVTKSAALEFGRDGVRVNSIHPGLIRTSGYLQRIPDYFMGRIPLRRAGGSDRSGTPEDVAGLVTFLASDAAAYVTGAEIVIDWGKFVVDGGLSQCRSSGMACGGSGQRIRGGEGGARSGGSQAAKPRNTSKPNLT
jgi:NAD(P)-dependent dehydrogenase (short-subunit alcohol dehydrogenase family)